MQRIEHRSRLDPAEAGAVDALLAAVMAADDHAPLDEQVWRDLAAGGSDGVTSLLAWDDARRGLVGYARVARDATGWALDLVVEPRHRTPPATTGPDLLADAARLVAARGGGPAQLWIPRGEPSTARAAAAIGLHPARSIYQMRRPLPVEPDVVGGPLPPTRPFVPGQDEAAWLAVNNRAFDWHPEQGGWDLATIEEREAAAWFDPAGFLLHEEGGKLVGFCWTKVHADHDPPLGEIYVIAVDPAAAGRGLGRGMTLAGLDHLARAGTPVGMLYVDATNTRAVKLYADLGFVVDHVDRAYAGGVAPA